MSNKILSTTNYSRFAFIEGNRIDTKHAKRVYDEVRRNNLLPKFPILVFKNGDGKLYIADGQNRFLAARTLGVPVYYIETQDMTLQEIAKINAVQKSWVGENHRDAWAALGNSNYLKVKDFQMRFGLPLQVSCQLLRGKSSETGRIRDFRSGDFKVTEEAFAEKVGRAILRLKPYAKFYKHRSFAVAMGKIMRIPQFRIERLLQKLEYQSTSLVRCVSSDQYVAIIETIYNKGSQAKDMLSLTIEVRKV